MDQVDHKQSFGHGLRVISPITCILSKDWADIQWPRKWGVARGQIAMENE